MPARVTRSSAIGLLLTISALGVWAAPTRYLSAFIQSDSHFKGDVGAFEQALGAPLSLYATYRAYGKPFPSTWADKMVSRGRGLLLFWEPWEYGKPLSQVSEDEYLRRWAGTLSRVPTPVLLVFGSEPNMNQDGYPVGYSEYRARYRTVATVMRRLAPRVEMVFSLAVPGVVREPMCSALYYPGDAWVDWVAFTSYDNGNSSAWGDLQTCLDWASGRWPGKPLGITEVGCNRRQEGTGTRLLSFLQWKLDTYPALRFVNYFSLDADQRAHAPKPFSYGLLPGSEAFTAMRWAAHSGKFTPLNQDGGRPQGSLLQARAADANDDPILLRKEALTLLYQALPASVTGHSTGAQDTASALSWLQAHQVVKGFAGGEDGAEEAILAYEFAIALSRAVSLPGVSRRSGSGIPLTCTAEAFTVGSGTRAALDTLQKQGVLRLQSQGELRLFDCVRRSRGQALLVRAFGRG
ncbi:MAG: hypothetical protein ABFE16_19875 [Armatimonadia bacterium]